MQALTMTAAETAIYDDDDNEPAQKKLMEELVCRGRAIADNAGETCEIYTADGIVAAVVDSEV